MRQFWLCFLCLCLVCGRAWSDDKKVSTGDTKTDAAIVDVQQNRKDITMCQAKLSTTYKVMDQELNEVSDAFFKAPNLMFLGGADGDKWVPSMISDAGTLWTYDAEEKIVTKFNRGRIYRETEFEVDAYIPDPLRPFRGVIWTSIRLSDASNKEMHVFDADLKPNLLSAQLPDALVRARLSISTKDGLLRKVQAFDSGGHEVVIQQYNAVKVDVTVSDKMFEFVIPSGAHVIDGTGDAVLLLKNLSAQ